MKKLLTKDNEKLLKLAIGLIAAEMRNKASNPTELNAGLYSIRDFVESFEVTRNNKIKW